MALMHGQALDRDRNTRGCMTVVKMDTPVRELAEKIIENEFPHHFCIAWADCREALKQTAALMNIPVIEM